MCSECRLLLGEGEWCDGGAGHRVYSLVSERQALVDHIWQRHRPAIRNGNPFARGLTVGLAAPAVIVGAVLLAFQTSVFGAVLCFVGGMWILRELLHPLWSLDSKPPRGTRSRRSRLQLPDASVLSLPDRRGVAGKVAGDCCAKSPCTGEACVAFAIRFVKRRYSKRHVMLRDAVTGGFELQLTDGRCLRVNPSRIVLDGPFNKVDVPEPSFLRAYLAAIDPEHGRDDDHEPYPYDEIQEVILRPGDRAEFIGDVELVPDASAPGTGYREHAASVLVPRGVPTFRVIEE